MRKTYSAEFKAKVVLEILKEGKSIAELATEYEIDSNMLNRWKREVIENLPSIFTDEQKQMKKIKEEHKKEKEKLYCEIGELTTQLAWLKKSCA